MWSITSTMYIILMVQTCTMEIMFPMIWIEATTHKIFNDLNMDFFSHTHSIIVYQINVHEVHDSHKLNSIFKLCRTDILK